MRVTRWLLLLAILCLTIACKRAAAPAPFTKAADVSAPANGPGGQAKRYIAIRQNIDIETAESDLQKAWTSALNYCGTIRCEVISSAIVNRAAGAAPSGSISVRVAPDDLAKLLDAVGKTGNLVRQSTEAEDKTATVIDVEARIRNLAEFRDSLRALLGRSNASLRDLIEVRKQLADVQSELDSETTKRKVLADETEKIAVDIRFNVQGSGAALSGLGKIGAALKESFSVLGDSAAALITFSFAALPWVLTLILAWWLVSKAIRRRVNK
jgi:hypothetical protein